LERRSQKEISKTTVKNNRGVYKKPWSYPLRALVRNSSKLGRVVGNYEQKKKTVRKFRPASRMVREGGELGGGQDRQIYVQ